MDSKSEMTEPDVLPSVLKAANSASNISYLTNPLKVSDLLFHKCCIVFCLILLLKIQ